MNSKSTGLVRGNRRSVTRGCIALTVLAVVCVVLLAPAARYYRGARKEYAAGPAGMISCLKDCLWLSYGCYHPPIDRIKIAQTEQLRLLVKPVRLDLRTSAGMGECASVAENAGGTVLATWMMRDDRDDQTYKVYARKLSIDGKPAGLDFRVNTGISSKMLAHHVCLRVDSDGYFYVVWNAARVPGELVRGGAGIFMRVFNRDGAPRAPEMQVSPNLSGAMPELAISPNGLAVVVWSDKGRVWGRLCSLNGPTEAPVRLDDAPEAAAAEFPAIAFGADGNLLVAWVDTRSGGRDVYVRLLGSHLRSTRPSIRAGDGPVPSRFFRLLSVSGTQNGYAVAWVRPGEQRGRWFNSDGRPMGEYQDILPAVSEVATLPLEGGGVLVSNGRSVRLWHPSTLSDPIPLLEFPSHPNEMSLSHGSEGIWLAWHDSLDERRIPALGDNLFIIAARVSLKETTTRGTNAPIVPATKYRN